MQRKGYLIVIGSIKGVRMSNESFELEYNLLTTFLEGTHILYPIKVECQVSGWFWNFWCQPIFGPSVECRLESIGNVGCR